MSYTSERLDLLKLGRILLKLPDFSTHLFMNYRVSFECFLMDFKGPSIHISVDLVLESFKIQLRVELT